MIMASRAPSWPGIRPVKTCTECKQAKACQQSHIKKTSYLIPTYANGLGLANPGNPTASMRLQGKVSESLLKMSGEASYLYCRPGLPKDAG